MRGRRFVIAALLSASSAAGQSVPDAPAPEEPPAAEESQRTGRSGKGTASVAEPEAEGVELQAELRIPTNYFWRGYALSQDAPALQPWVQATWRGVSAYAWGSAALDRRTELDELALGASWQRELGSRFTVLGGYHYYLSPGTETEPSADPVDGLAPTWSGEMMLSVVWSPGPAYLQVTYSRGHRDGRGNSLNVWAQRSFATRWPSLTVDPYVQADYLDEYAPPPAFRERLSGLEGGVMLQARRGGATFSVVAAAVHVPSRYVRESNLAAGSAAGAWGGFAAVAVGFRKLLATGDAPAAPPPAGNERAALRRGGPPAGLR